MLSCIIRHDLMNHLMSTRFFASLIMTLLLVVTNTFVLIGTYQERGDDYSQRESLNRERIDQTPTYSLLALKIQRPTTPLSVFSAGLETRFGSEVDIAFDSVPTLFTPRIPLGLKNPYLKLFSQIDLVCIFQVVLSLLALLFAYDAIAGDWESGTLRLMLSHPVGRGTILFAKYIAAMGCLLLPLVMSLLMSLMLCSLSSSLQLTSDHFLRIGGIGLTTIVYLSFFYLMGLLISATTRRASTSLMLCVFLWVFTVILYPNWAHFTLNSVAAEARVEKISIDQQIEQIWEEAEREERHFLTESRLQGRIPVFRGIFGNVSWRHGGFPRIQGELKDASSSLVEHVRRFYKFSASQRIRSAEKVGLVREQLETHPSLRKALWTQRLMKLSPAALYTFTTSAWAGTDLHTMKDYVRSAQVYRHTLINAFEDKNVFGSLQWFAVDQGDIDWSILPRFYFQRPDITQAAAHALPNLLLMLLSNLIMFIVTFLIFIKIEV